MREETKSLSVLNASSNQFWKNYLLEMLYIILNSECKT